MEQQFIINQGTDLTVVTGSVVATDLDVPQASLELLLEFDLNSVAIPNQADVDTLVFAAFNQPFVPALIMLLQELPPANPFSGTTSVLYEVG